MTMRLLDIRSGAGQALLLLLVTLGLGACSEDPNPVGAGLLPSSDFLKIDTASTTAIRSHSQPAIPLASTTRLLVGAVDDIESWGVLRFYGLPDSISDLKIASAEIILRTTYHYGDSLAPFSLMVHKLLQTWGTDSLTIDSLKAPGFYDPTPLSSVNLPFVGDTDFVSIPVDTTVIRSWGTMSDTTIKNFGILLKPAGTGVVKGFAMFESSTQDHIPKLRMRFLRDESGSVDTVTVTTGVSRFCARMGNTSWTTDSTHIYVRNGIAYRGILEFNIEFLPAHGAIHKATLELAIDPAQSRFNSYTVDSTFVFFIDNNGAVVSAIFGLSEPVQSDAVRIHRFAVGQFVQRWVRGPTQHKIAIAGLGEPDALDLFVFHGAAAPQALKPKLTIIYSLIR